MTSDGYPEKEDIDEIVNFTGKPMELVEILEDKWYWPKMARHKKGKDSIGQQ